MGIKPYWISAFSRQGILTAKAFLLYPCRGAHPSPKSGLSLLLSGPSPTAFPWTQGFSPSNSTSSFPKGMFSLASRTLLMLSPLPGMPFPFPFFTPGQCNSFFDCNGLGHLGWVLFLLFLLNAPFASPVSPNRAYGQAGLSVCFSVSTLVRVSRWL